MSNVLTPLMNPTKQNFHYILSLFLLTFVVGIPYASVAQPAGSDTTYAITKAHIWLEGATNINHFSCETSEADGMGGHNNALEMVDSVMNVDYSPESNSMNSLQGWLKVTVGSLDCGNKHMNKDVYHSLKSERFPNIFFSLESAHLIKPGLTEENPFKVETKGQLTIAGQTRDIKVVAQGYRLATGCFRVKGSEPILMSDFNIDPPSPFFGIVKTKDQITVHFDLIATPVSINHFASANSTPPCNAGVELTD